MKKQKDEVQLIQTQTQNQVDPESDEMTQRLAQPSVEHGAEPQALLSQQPAGSAPSHACSTQEQEEVRQGHIRDWETSEMGWAFNSSRNTSLSPFL